MFGRKQEPPRETTATILQNLENAPYRNVVISAAGARFLISTDMLKFLIWSATPDAIKDEHSEEAKKWSLARTGFKAFIRPFFADLVKHFFGEGVQIEPRLNTLTWLSKVVPLLAVNLLASKEWSIHVQACEGCGDNVFQIIGLSSNADNLITPGATSNTPLPTADHESISGREDHDSSGQADRDLVGGPLGNMGNDGQRENDSGEGTSDASPTGVSGGTHVLSGYEAVGGLR